MPCFRWEVSNSAIYSSRTMLYQQSYWSTTKLGTSSAKHYCKKLSVSLNKIDICVQLSLKRNNLCFNLCYKGISLWLCFQGLVIASIKAPSGLELNQSGLYFYGNVYEVYDMVVLFVIYKLSSQQSSLGSDIIGFYHGLVPVRCQAIIRTNAARSYVTELHASFSLRFQRSFIY